MTPWALALSGAGSLPWSPARKLLIAGADGLLCGLGGRRRQGQGSRVWSRFHSGCRRQLSAGAALGGGPGPGARRQQPGTAYSSDSRSHGHGHGGPGDMKSFLWESYRETKKVCQDLILSDTHNMLNPDAIFANNEVCLSDIEIYGFDYDYTLAFYSIHLHSLIFNTAREMLIQQHKYPEGLRSYEYNANFAIRGLHYDVQKGILMKIDAFHYIQLGTIYRGLSPVSDEEILEMYEGTHVPLEQMSDFYGKSSHGNTLKQFMDIFSLPELTLLSCVNDYFMKHNIDFEPVYLYRDVNVRYSSNGNNI